MNLKFLKKILRPLYRVLSYLPLVHFFIVRRTIRTSYHNEILLLEGRHKTDNTNQSILFFTVHKAASIYVSNIMKRLARDMGMTPINIDGYFYDIMKSREWKSKGRVVKKNIYKPIGYFYGPFRTFNPAVPNPDDYQILLVLRDPRDAVVSQYFSFLYSHGFPFLTNRKQIEAKMHKRKKRISEETVDDYVIRLMNSDYIKKYYTYCQELIGKPNVLFLKYEDMVNDFDSWLKSILEFFRLNVNRGVVNDIIRNADFKVEKENIYSHKRQVIPGDYKRKLKRETIEELNKKWEEILKILDYPI